MGFSPRKAAVTESSNPKGEATGTEGIRAAGKGHTQQNCVGKQLLKPCVVQMRASMSARC